MIKTFAAIVLSTAMVSADDRVWTYEQLIAEYSWDITDSDSITLQYFNKIEARTEDDGTNWIFAKSYKTTASATFA